MQSYRGDLQKVRPMPGDTRAKERPVLSAQPRYRDGYRVPLITGTLRVGVPTDAAPEPQLAYQCEGGKDRSSQQSLAHPGKARSRCPGSFRQLGVDDLHAAM